MDNVTLKNQMKDIWIESFGDSRDYVDLLFDKYFNPEYVAYSQHDGNVIASLIGIPYEFKSLKGELPILKGLYLCGLSTKPAFRKQGIMSRLLEEINEKARQNGFDFTFLIPADDIMSIYYGARGYTSSFFSRELRFVSDHSFYKTLVNSLKNNKDKLSILYHYESLACIRYEDWINQKDATKQTAETSLSPKEELIRFLTDYEIRPQTSISNEVQDSPSSCEVDYSILHTEEDWKVVIEENVISSNHIYICMDSKNKIQGVAFLEERKNDILVKRIIYKDPLASVKILENIKQDFPEQNLTVRTDPSEGCVDQDEKQIWVPFYIHNNPPSDEYEDVSNIESPVLNKNLMKSFAMCRILRESEILKKITNDSVVPKFLNLAELQKLLLRRPTTPDYAGEALNLPLINLSAYLLLE